MSEIHEEAADRLTRLLLAEKVRTCGEESRQKYADLHKARFADILRICRNQVPSPKAKVLDVGRSELTAHLLSFYRNVHTLGLAASIDDGGHREISSLDRVPHVTFDLLESRNLSAWPQCGAFDLIVFSEVIEHLSIAPEFVFGCLGSLLAEGGFLVCSTPNAANLSA
jgi:SAM-dependent methyltransferase